MTAVVDEKTVLLDNLLKVTRDLTVQLKAVNDNLERYS